MNTDIATTRTGKQRPVLERKLEWVHLSLMRVNPHAQRDLNMKKVAQLRDEFDPERLGTPTVSHRDGIVWIIDGQHRVEAMRLVGWGDQQIQCWAYYGLNETEEAEMFLQLNNQLVVSAFSKFKVGVKAGRAEEVAIDNIVRACGLKVSRGKSDGSISAVSTLRHMYRLGPDVLARTLATIKAAFGDPGLDASLMQGVALVMHRYGSDVNDERLRDRLAKTMGGVNGLIGKANALVKATSNPKPICMAAAVVEVYNSGRGGRTLPPWFKTENGGSNGRAAANKDTASV